MATRTDHVTLRDGSDRRGGPRPAPPARPAKAPAEEKTPADGRYSDPSTVGWYDETDGFKSAHGHPSPRQKAEAGNDPGGGEHVTPDRSEEMIRRPLD